MLVVKVSMSASSQRIISEALNLRNINLFHSANL